MDNRKFTDSFKDKIKETYQFVVGCAIAISMWLTAIGVLFAIMFIISSILTGCKTKNIYNEYEIEVVYEDNYRDTIFIRSQVDPVLVFRGDESLIITWEDIIEGDIQKIKIISINGK